MAFLDSKHQRAALIIVALGAAILWSLGPYGTGIIGIPVLAVLFAPLHAWVVRRGMHTGFASLLVTLLGAVLLIVPGIVLAGLVINEAQQVAQSVLQSPIIDRFRGLQFRGIPVGPRLAEAGGRIVAAIGASAFGLVGTATRLTLNLTISFFGLYYVLKHPGDVWLDARPYIPFSDTNTEKLGKRFKDVTVSTVVGTGVVAAIQGGLLGIAFWAAGLPNALFWSVVTMALAILPVVGSGLVWGPAAIVLIMQDRVVPGVLLIIWGVLVVGSVDNFIRPLIYRRFSAIHPLITLIGAIGGVAKFGLLGLLIGPLALSYFFELIRMYREEYLEPESATPNGSMRARG
jgi:predicted PurR-regulated permease PerM